MRSGGEVVKSSPLNPIVGFLRPTMILVCCLRVKQRYLAQKNNEKNCMYIITRSTTAFTITRSTTAMKSSYVHPLTCG